MKNVKIVLGILAIILIVLVGGLVANIAKTNKTAFGNQIIFSIGEQIKFSDGLIVTLVEINDSRCKQGVVCIWAGELSPLLRIAGGTLGESQKDVRLGTATAHSVTESEYTFILQEATKTTATITVTN
jgi:hypothetical protein